MRLPNSDHSIMQLVHRTANITDLSFIYGCLLYGARKGHYAFNAENPEVVRQMKKEIQSVITYQHLLDDRYAVALVYTLNNKRIAISIMSEDHLHGHSLEIYAVSVARQFQNLGYGSQVIDELIFRHQHTNIVARCSAASEKMNALLENRGFKFIFMDENYRVLMREAFVIGHYIEPVYLRS